MSYSSRVFVVAFHDSRPSVRRMTSFITECFVFRQDPIVTLGHWQRKTMKLLRDNARVNTASTTYERHNKSRRLGHLAVASLLTRRYFGSSSVLINVTCLIRHSLRISGSDIKMTQRLDLV